LPSALRLTALKLPLLLSKAWAASAVATRFKEWRAHLVKKKN
jgi:hypothetical protein